MFLREENAFTLRGEIYNMNPIDLALDLLDGTYINLGNPLSC